MYNDEDISSVNSLITIRPVKDTEERSFKERDKNQKKLPKREKDTVEISSKENTKIEEASKEKSSRDKGKNIDIYVH